MNNIYVFNNNINLEKIVLKEKIKIVRNSFNNFKDLEDKILELPTESIIFIDISTLSKEEIKQIRWFNNPYYYLEMNINKTIIDKNQILFKLVNPILENKEFTINIFDLVYAIKNYCCFPTFNRKDESKSLKKELSKIKNCIVVGNGPAKNHPSPEYIDSKDYVVRVNNARILGYEDIVGKKTNLYMRNTSKGCPDTEGINFSDKKIKKITSYNLFNKTEREWFNSGYLQKFNWYQIFRKTGFWYFEHMNSYDKIKDYYIRCTGAFSICYLLSNGMQNNYTFELYTSGFEFSDKHWEKIYDKNYKISKGNMDKEGQYYYDVGDTYKFQDKNNTSWHEGELLHRHDLWKKVFGFLVENKIILQ